MDRSLFAPHLHGRGVDLGPGHLPFPDVTLVDRWLPADTYELFPELQPHRLPTPDVIADFNAGLPFRDNAFDFTVCAHVIEHVADPLGFLNEIRRITHDVVVLVVPDRTQSFDAGRPATTLDHLIGECGRTEVDDAHIVEFLDHVTPFWAGTPLEPIHQCRDLGWHRNRSVHAHCWTADEFDDVLAFSGWRIIERFVDLMEFGYVLCAS